MTEPRRDEPREGGGWDSVTVQGLQQHKGRQYRTEPAIADAGPGPGRAPALLERE